MGETQNRPKSQKFICELVCFLYLRFQEMVPLKEILSQDTQGEITAEMIDSKRRSYSRYIREILACENLSQEDLESDWFVFYYMGTFYRGDIAQVSQDYAIDKIRIFTNTKQILPLELSLNDWEEDALEDEWGAILIRIKRLKRAMWLAEKIVSDMESDMYRKDIEDSGSARLRYFQASFWPEKRDAYQESLYLYCKKTNCNRSIRTIQRDMKAVVTAVDQYYEMGARIEEASFQRARSAHFASIDQKQHRP